MFEPYYKDLGCRIPEWWSVIGFGTGYGSLARNKGCGNLFYV